MVASSRIMAGICLIAVLLAGCTSTPAAPSTPAPGTPAPSTASSSTATTNGPASSIPASSAPAPSTPAPSTVPTTVPSTPAPSTVRTTVTQTKPGVTITVSPPKATAEPAAVTGECPYLRADVVSDITGQHHGPTQLVDLSPQPMCVFYRSDGGLMGSVRVIMAASPQAAVAAVNQHVPVSGSQPASQPSGWVGGSMTTPGQMTQDSVARSVYAVSKGNIAIIAQENESPSIKARVMAVCAIYGLDLETGQAPDYCSGPQR